MLVITHSRQKPSLRCAVTDKPNLSTVPLPTCLPLFIYFNVFFHSVALGHRQAYMSLPFAQMNFLLLHNPANYIPSTHLVKKKNVILLMISYSLNQEFFFSTELPHINKYILSLRFFPLPTFTYVHFHNFPRRKLAECGSL